jgi:hypothetical protein
VVTNAICDAALVYQSSSSDEKEARAKWTRLFPAPVIPSPMADCFSLTILVANGWPSISCLGN